MRVSILSFFKILTVFWFLMLMISCERGDRLLVDGEWYHYDLQSVAEAVIARDADKLLEWTGHENEMISDMAWKALVHSDVEDISRLFKYSIDNDDSRAWFVLSFKEVNESDLERIIEKFKNNGLNMDHVCEFMYRKGGKKFLNLLLDSESLLMNHQKCSKAAGAIITRAELSDETVQDIFRLIFESENESTVQNLLYGFWRSSLNRPEKSSEAHQIITDLLHRRTSRPATLADEYLIGITGETGFESVMSRRTTEELYNNVHLGVVTARALAEVENGTPDKNHVEKLLNHPNAHVVAETLDSMKRLNIEDREWLASLADKIHHFPENAEVAVLYLELLQKNDEPTDRYRELIQEIDQNNPYLKDRILELLKHFLDDEQYLDQLAANLQTEGVEAIHAAGALQAFVDEREEIELYRPKIREMLLSVLDQQNRSVLSVADSLYMNENLFSSSDLNMFYSSFEVARSEQNRPVQEALAAVLEHFGEKVDESLMEIMPKSFRLPDWERLQEFRENPRWILETNHGTITVELNLLDAPFTVSSIIYLTEENFYDDAAFHRVVRNFVIQGGDFDRRDGFGGPDYRIPTEPSFSNFERGSAGMASSGPDTEGSQFFFTHTWTPHLDGLYTIFGEVIEGMDVVDSIQIGDKILRARIE